MNESSFGGTGGRTSVPRLDIMSGAQLDMSDVIPYENLISQLTTVNSMNGPLFMKELNVGMDIVSRHYSTALFEYEKAKDASTKAWAVAKLDKAPRELQKRNEKVTDALRDCVANMDAEYIACRDREAMCRAMMVFLSTKLDRFQKAHDDAKKIYDKTKDPEGSIPSMGIHGNIMGDKR